MESPGARALEVPGAMRAHGGVPTDQAKILFAVGERPVPVVGPVVRHDDLLALGLRVLAGQPVLEAAVERLGVFVAPVIRLGLNPVRDLDAVRGQDRRILGAAYLGDARLQQLVHLAERPNSAFRVRAQDAVTFSPCRPFPGVPKLLPHGVGALVDHERCEGGDVVVDVGQQQARALTDEGPQPLGPNGANGSFLVGNLVPVVDGAVGGEHRGGSGFRSSQYGLAQGRVVLDQLLEVELQAVDELQHAVGFFHGVRNLGPEVDAEP